VAVTAVVFDVGETLVDETRDWEVAADLCGLPRFTLMALVGAAIARGESHRRAFDWLGVELPQVPFTAGQLYPDALPSLRELRRRGLLVGAAGNMAVVHEDPLRDHLDFVASSERWGVEKPAAAFFARVADETGRPEHEIAYVGDRVDNDVRPALAAGMVAVHVRRGPWGHLQEPPPQALSVRSLGEVPEVLANV
jgi:HAD superfamily hydrolase (TIGR01549 family)